MKLHIERSYVDAMVTEYPELTQLKEQLRFGNRAEIPINQLSSSELGFLQNLYRQAGPEMSTQAAMISTLQKALNDDEERFTANDLERLVPTIADFLVNDAIRGWLFRVNSVGQAMAYLITRLDYTPPGEEEAGRMLIELKANSRGKIAIENLIIRRKDINGQSISEIFAATGPENPMWFYLPVAVRPVWSMTKIFSAIVP